LLLLLLLSPWKLNVSQKRVFLEVGKRQNLESLCQVNHTDGLVRLEVKVPRNFYGRAIDFDM
jgi:hypothetical protein